MKRFLKTIVVGIVLTPPLAILHEEAGGVTGRAAGGQTVEFNRDIQPILAGTCYECHGPAKALGQLRLDVKKLAMKGGISGPAIVPGNSKESRLIARLLGLGGEMKMPLGGELTTAQIDMFRRWIDQGAVWPDTESAVDAKSPGHWAYLKPISPPIPNVKGSTWVRSPIDNFVLARLENEGLRPSPDAEKGKLLRRVYLDLIGIPPSPKELKEFLSDQSSSAYERVVDRLLASPHYGERWARHWLDMARYSDSNGYEKDNLRVMWKYRDWVIDAFNQDKPFDQFTIEQIAGDMLPDATREQRIATGFHRNTMLNQEGGIDPEEARFETIVDRVNTTATVWLGSTLACAQCHNHKYDPFSQKDYYRFYAFFEGAEFQTGYQSEGDDNSRYVKEPEIILTTPEQESKRLELETEIKHLTEVLKTQTPELDAAQATWEQGLVALERKWVALDPTLLTATGGTILTRQQDRSVFVSGPNPESGVYTVRARSGLRSVTGLRIEALADSRLPQMGPGRDPYGNFLLTGLEVDLTPATRPTRGEPLTFRDGGVDDSAVRFDAKKLTERASSNPAKPGVAKPAVDSPGGWYINATRDPVRFDRQAVLTFAKPVAITPGKVFTVRLKFEGGSLGQGIGRFRLSVTGDPDPQAITLLPARLRPTLKIPLSQRTKAQQEGLATQFRGITPLLKPQRDRVKELNRELAAAGITSAMVMQERAPFERPSTFFRERGNFLLKGERLSADVPKFLPPMPESWPVNRLGLARWLVSEENPLTARVTVNRIWEQLFGRGIVETSEDFGTQSGTPSHPELLDWLATEFIRQKWSFKRLVRTIVTSATYRQSSAVTAMLEERDPYNRLLARGPRFRAEAEMIRDIALTASGLLSRKIGGPSVYPLQPEGIWRNPYSSARWVTSPGEDRYRRSIYTFIRRTSPNPSMMAFDATSRETCTVRRIRTNTPLQALTGLNDEAFFELARGLARRMVAEAGDTEPRARIGYGFLLCTSREASPAELARLVRFYQEQRERLVADAEATKSILKSESQSGEKNVQAELAALTMVSNLLLNLDETLTKE
jgi:hypothetical protein